VFVHGAVDAAFFAWATSDGVSKGRLMATIERLARMVGAGEALAFRCLPCGEDWRIARDAAIAVFGPDATTFEARSQARCHRCNQVATFDGVAAMDQPGKPPPRLRSLPMAPPETITFALCRLAGWTVYGHCEGCRTLKLLYSPQVQGGPTPQPTILIGPTWRAGGLTCGPCRRPFSTVRIKGRHGDIAAWGERPPAAPR